MIYVCLMAIVGFCIIILLMKEGLIEARVTRLANLSEKIQEFINEKSTTTYTPFYRDEDDPYSRQHDHRAKRSLTDWRQLYQKTTKINPKVTLYPSTAEGFRPRCSVTGQCQRSRKAYTAAKTSTADRNFLTRQTRRANMLESKRESVVQFAIAQNCYQQEVLKDQKNFTAKARKFMQRKGGDPRQRDILKIGLRLSHVSEFASQQVKDLSATQKYINEMKDFQYVKMTPYNMVKIKEYSKIDNTRYLQATAHVRKAQSSEQGLRYYERA